MPDLVVSAPSAGVSNVCEAESGSKRTTPAQNVSFRSGTPPLLCLTDVTHMINAPGLPPLFFHTASDQTLDCEKA